MKAMLKRMTAALGMVLLGTILAATAKAECGSWQRPNGGASLQPQSWQGGDEFGPASLLLVSDHESEEPIVGPGRYCWSPKATPRYPMARSSITDTPSGMATEQKS